MNEQSIKIRSTDNPRIIKFEIDSFLFPSSGEEYANIDEATDSPLAQQLFYFPFVKTVYMAGNFLALERYDIVEWPEVQEAVAQQIAEYLNSGRPVIDKPSPKKIPVTVYAESTPNPSVMKFVANRPLVNRVIECKDIDEAVHTPLASALFHFPFVKEVFLDENYVSVTKYDMADWGQVAMELRGFIRDYLEDGKPVQDETASATETKRQLLSNDSQVPLKGISKEIVDILEEYVKPAVASDGGNILFDSYDEDKKTVRVILQGACSGCPSSTYTLKNGIETMLRQMLHGKVEYVEALNG